MAVTSASLGELRAPECSSVSAALSSRAWLAWEAPNSGRSMSRASGHCQVGDPRR